MSFRNIGGIDREHFYHDLYSFPVHYIFRMNDIDEKLNFFDDFLLNLLNFYAPIQARIIKNKTSSPRLSSNTLYLMSLRDDAYKSFRATKNLRNGLTTSL